MRVGLSGVSGVAVILATGCGPSESDFSEFSRYSSPDGSYHLVIDSAHSKLSFGPETVRVYLVEKSEGVRRHIVTTKIANDGGGLGEANIKAAWIQADTVRFCLSGVEQEDRVLEINARLLSHAESSGECSQ